MIGLTLALYLALYLALIVAYVSVLKYMAEKPEEVLQVEAAEQAATPAGRDRRRRCCRTGSAAWTVMSFDAALPVIFMALMGVSMLVYVVSDGYDLGVGMLMHRATDAEKDVMVASIGPFWDANETWLVLGVGILLVAFPKAHGLVLGELYLPVALMLVGLTLRGVAFDFRVKAQGQRTSRPGTGCSSPARRWPRWRRAGCSGRYVSGFGTGWNYPLFAAAIAVALPMAYVLMGATWLDHEDRGRAAGARRAVGAHRLGADGRRPGADLDGHALGQRDGARALVRAARDHRAGGDSADDAARPARACAACWTRAMCAGRCAGCRSCC